jgi:hypothetical protein
MLTRFSWNWRRGVVAFALVALLQPPVLVPMQRSVAAQEGCRTFAETGKGVCGRFLAYWQGNGGLAQQGFPISGEMQERSDTDGKTYAVQYFERAVFEMHPENQRPYDVLLSLLGSIVYKQKYPNGAPGQQPNAGSGSRLFPETGKRLGGAFLDYWLKNRGLAQQGFPVSDEFMETSQLDGKRYRVQYFERAVFELHPENSAPYDVLLSQLGTFRYRAKYAAGLQATPTRAAQVCIPTTSYGSMPSRPTAPFRSSVGTGHVLRGVVRSSPGCAPIAGAHIIFWLADPAGQYDDAHRAAVITGSDGSYRFESNFPGEYGGMTPHIHAYVWAGGHLDVITEYLPPRGATEGTLDIALVREK